MASVRLAAFAVVVAAAVGCRTPPPENAENPARKPSLAVGDPLYERYEGTGFKNACRSDADCNTSGCGSEVCAADSVVSTCDVVPTPPGTCGCVAGVCQWYR